MQTKFKNYTTDEIKKTFGKNIKKYRIIKNITQQELAEKLKISTVFVSRLENGKYGVQFKNIVAIANILEIEPYLLFKD